MYVYCYFQNQFCVFQATAHGYLHSDVSIEYTTAPVSLTESVFRMYFFHHLNNDSKSRQNIIGNVASSYQVNLAIEIPNITKKYINLHIFYLLTLGICNALLNIRHVVGKFLIG